MKKSLLTPRRADRSLHICKLVLPAILTLGATATSAQFSGGNIGQPPSNSNSFVGTWRGVFQRIWFTIVIQPNGQYTQTAQSGTLMTQQSGPYRLVPPNTIIFSVTSWAPTSQEIYHPYPPPSAGGYYTNEVVAKPPGATDSYVFNGPDTITLTDQMMHGSITLKRVR